MASVYGKISAPKVADLKFLPIKTKLPDGTPVEIDVYRESELEAGRKLLNDVIEEGLSWPFEDQLGPEGFKSYFLGNAAAFVVRAFPTPEDRQTNVQNEDGSEIWGTFHVKTNFPGRCSHFCNGGFITDPPRRRRGVGKLMGSAFLRLAKDLGYRASYFNLVFRTNEASLRLWRNLGFTELAVVPKAGSLKGIDGLVDAIQFYYDLDNLTEEDLPKDLRP